MPKTNEQWLAETAESKHLTTYKLAVIGQLALKEKGIQLIEEGLQT